MFSACVCCAITCVAVTAAARFFFAIGFIASINDLDEVGVRLWVRAADFPAVDDGEGDDDVSERDRLWLTLLRGDVCDDIV